MNPQMRVRADMNRDSEPHLAEGWLGFRNGQCAKKASAGEHVRDMAHTNGIESFWATMERGHKGVVHKFSKKHLQRHVDGFSGRHNARNADTLVQMRGIVCGMFGKELRYKELAADNGLASGAKS